MGKSPDDIASEIEGLRKESDVIVDELLRRANPTNVARGMTSTVTERASSVLNEAATVANDAALAVSHLTNDMPEPIRQHPMASTYATVGLVAGLIGFAVSWISIMRRPTPRDRAEETMREYRKRARSTLRDYWYGMQGLRRYAQDARTATVRREEPGMVKRLLWVGMASVMATLGSMLFKRMTASLWRTTMKENPPEK